MSILDDDFLKKQKRKPPPEPVQKKYVTESELRDQYLEIKGTYEALGLRKAARVLGINYQTLKDRVERLRKLGLQIYAPTPELNRVLELISEHIGMWRSGADRHDIAIVALRSLQYDILELKKGNKK